MRRKKNSSLRVDDFHQRFSEQLELSQAGAPVGGDRLITEATINRPGLALAGYLKHFAANRIQVFGTAECSFFEEMGIDHAILRLQAVTMFEELPCLIVSRGVEIPEEILETVNAKNVAVFVTTLRTTEFINRATILLEREFAERTSLHGCMVDIRGIGVLIRGKSGTGKSEAVIGILERGGGLIADDLVHVENVSGRLICSAPELAQGFIEMRGIGIVNIANLYGLGAIEQEKELDLIITLRPAASLNEVDRLGLERKELSVLGHGVPHVELPVAPGRDIARLIEVAAMDQRLKTLGHDMAEDFNQKLLKRMRDNA